MRGAIAVYLWAVLGFALMGRTLGGVLLAFFWPAIPVVQFVRRFL